MKSCQPSMLSVAASNWRRGPHFDGHPVRFKVVFYQCIFASSWCMLLSWIQNLQLFWISSKTRVFPNNNVVFFSLLCWTMYKSLHKLIASIEVESGSLERNSIFLSPMLCILPQYHMFPSRKSSLQNICKNVLGPFSIRLYIWAEEENLDTLKPTLPASPSPSPR